MGSPSKFFVKLIFIISILLSGMDSNIDIATAMAQVYPAMFSPGCLPTDPTADEAGGLIGYGGGAGKVLGIRDQAKRLGHRVKLVQL